MIVTVGADTHDKDIHKMESFDHLTNQWKPIGRTPLKVNGHSVVISGENGNIRIRQLWTCNGAYTILPLNQSVAVSTHCRVQIMYNVCSASKQL